MIKCKCSMETWEIFSITEGAYIHLLHPFAWRLRWENRNRCCAGEMGGVCHSYYWGQHQGYCSDASLFHSSWLCPSSIQTQAMECHEAKLLSASICSIHQTLPGFIKFFPIPFPFSRQAVLLKSPFGCAKVSVCVYLWDCVHQCWSFVLFTEFSDAHLQRASQIQGL